MTKQLPLTIDFQETKITEALLLLANIKVTKDEVYKVSIEDMRNIAYDIIYEVCYAIMTTMKDEDKRTAVLDQFINESGLKYLERKTKLVYKH